MQSGQKIPALFITASGDARPGQANADGLHLRLFRCRLGPWPGGKKAFEAECDCELKFVALEDGVSLLNRLRMEGKNSAADVVLGLDNNLLQAAQQTDLFSASQVDTSKLTVPGGWHNQTFVPYDYGYFAFVYNKDKLKNPPTSLKELVSSDRP